MTDHTDMADRIAPPWLRRPVGARLLYALTAPLDALAEWAFQGIKARFPLVGTPTALGAIGRDRGIRRGPAESDDAFAGRLVPWLDDHKTSGSPWALLEQLAGFLAPAPPMLRLVTSNGTSALWYTRAPDGTRSRHVETPTNWNWDGAGAELRTRVFVIIYAAGGVPYATGGQWGGGTRQWGDGGTIGTSASSADIAGVLGVVGDWTAAHAFDSHVIVAFDPSSFNPATPAGTPGMPDGTWAHWHKIVGGVAVPTRLQTARYWEVG